MMKSAAAPARCSGYSASIVPPMYVHDDASICGSQTTTILPSKSVLSERAFVGVSSASPSHKSPV